MGRVVPSPVVTPNGLYQASARQMWLKTGGYPLLGSFLDLDCTITFDTVDYQARDQSYKYSRWGPKNARNSYRHVIHHRHGNMGISLHLAVP